MSSVRVIDEPQPGEHTFPRAVADVYFPGELTVTSEDDGAVLKVFGPERWRACSVYGAGSYEVAHFENSFVQAQEAERLAAANADPRRA